jgi:FixJ family two-component response regulator
MIGKRSLVSVVDDDESVRESLPDLLRQFGFSAHAFSCLVAEGRSTACSSR